MDLVYYKLFCSVNQLEETSDQGKRMQRDYQEVSSVTVVLIWMDSLKKKKTFYHNNLSFH